MRKLFNGKVFVGFVGFVVDVFILFEKFEVKFEEYNGNLKWVVVEFVKEWCSDKVFRKFEVMLIVMN